MKSVIVIANLLSRLSFLFIILSTLNAATFGQAVLVSDAHTSQTSTNGNFGSNQVVKVSSNNIAYVKFEIASTLPAGTKGDDVAKAIVRFYLSEVATAGKLDLHAILSEWDEASITANNAPQIGPPVLTTPQISTQTADNYLLIDITGLVKQWLGNGTGQNGIPNYGFALIPHAIDLDTPQLANIDFDSKENPHTSHDAALSIQLKASVTPAQNVTTDPTLVGDGTITSPLGVASGAITSTHLANGAVMTDKLVDGAVTSAKIADNAVGSTKLADNAVDTAKIADNAVGTTKLLNGSVNSAKIAVPLSLTSANPAFTLSVANTGSGPALTAVGPINTSSHYSIDGDRVLRARSDDLFVGFQAGMNQTPNYSGGNSFFGRAAGRDITTGHGNSFFGHSSGLLNTVGYANSFFGTGTGVLNTTGIQNTFVGGGTGRNNTTGAENSFFGASSGLGNQTGSFNTFVGSYADFPPGTVNETGNRNTLLGAYSELSPNISNATAIGSRALVTQSNSLVLGGISLVNGGTDTNVGIGTTAPKTKLHVARGKLYLDSFNASLIMRSPNGSCFEVEVTDAGVLTVQATACP